MFFLQFILYAYFYSTAHWSGFQENALYKNWYCYYFIICFIDIFYVLAKKIDIEKVELTEKTFRWQLNEDEMATDKLAEGIRKFSIDGVKLENIIRKRLVV